MRNWRSSRTKTCKGSSLKRPRSKKNSSALTLSMGENSRRTVIDLAEERVALNLVNQISLVLIVHARGLEERDVEVEGGRR